MLKHLHCYLSIVEVSQIVLMFISLFIFIRDESKNTQIEKRNMNYTKIEQTDILLIILRLIDSPTDRVEEKEMKY